MANLDPQVQIRIIDIAKEWAEKVYSEPEHTSKRGLKERAEHFDLVYKAIIKTVSEK